MPRLSPDGTSIIPNCPNSALPGLGIASYLSSGHFISATFENFESEFLQMALYVILTVFLRQEGSAESKKVDGKEEVDREPKVHKDAPWPAKKGMDAKGI